MENIDIFRKALWALEEGRPVALVSVIATTGSTPGKVGYKMLVSGKSESIVGTVGGGFLEAKMIKEALAMLMWPAVRVFQFRIGETPDDEKGICGGSIEFLIETFDSASVPFFREITDIQGRKDNGVIFSIIAPGELPRKIYLALPEPGEAPVNMGQGLLGAEIVEAAREMLAEGSNAIRVSADGLDVLVEPLAKAHIVIIFGAGHVSSHIARFARLVHFGVIVCDDRPEYANHERFPDADQIVVEDFTRAFDKMRLDGRSYIVIVTRGHKHDKIVLEQAVRTEVRYIGMIGSDRKTLMLLESLREQGIPQERIDRVYAPIGISIGAVDAEEIALSIVSELVKIRRLGDKAKVGHMSLSRRESHD